MRRVIFFLIFSSIAFSENVQRPWFTGPLLAPAGHTVAPGRTNYQPYLFVTKNYQPDSSWVINPFVQITRGLTSHMDLKIETQVPYTFKNGEVGGGLADFAVALGFQAMEDNLDGWMPDLRITLGEVFPTGKYQRLNPNKHGTDGTGKGSYITGASFNFQKLFHIKNEQWLRPRLFLLYQVPSSVDVHEFNSHGGGFGTDGNVNPGNIFTGILAFEYALNQNWVLALDIQALYAEKVSFTGDPGVDKNGNTASIGNGKKVQWSYAPAVEYNFNSWLGIIWGAWFTGATRNSSEFVSYVVSVNIVL